MDGAVPLAATAIVCVLRGSGEWGGRIERKRKIEGEKEKGELLRESETKNNGGGALRDVKERK